VASSPECWQSRPSRRAPRPKTRREECETPRGFQICPRTLLRENDQFRAAIGQAGPAAGIPKLLRRSTTQVALEASQRHSRASVPMVLPASLSKLMSARESLAVTFRDSSVRSRSGRVATKKSNNSCHARAAICDFALDGAAIHSSIREYPARRAPVHAETTLVTNDSAVVAIDRNVHREP
jgi:hypothetical protein